MSARYAVVKTGGKQYRVSEGRYPSKLRSSTSSLDHGVELNDVLMVVNGEDVQLGQPNVAGAKVEAEVQRLDLAPKVMIFKYRRRHRYRRKAGTSATLYSVESNADRSLTNEIR